MRLGPWEIALIVLFVIMFFGAKKIPEVMRGFGSGIREFKKGLHEDDTPPPSPPPAQPSKTISDVSKDTPNQS